MSWYNHFGLRKYQSICFSKIGIGEKFRMNKWKGNRRRYDIVMVKDSDVSYHELLSGVKYESYSPIFDVSSYDKLLNYESASSDQG